MQLAVSNPTNREFYQVGGVEHPEKMSVVTEIFNRILTPLYGSQDKALQQIRESKDRKCFLLYENEMPAGVLVFKTILSNEFAEFGLRNSIEVKSLFVDQSQQNSGRGLGSALIDKLKEEVEHLSVPFEGIHVTVSETKEDSLMFFKKKGFIVAHAWKGRYITDVTEYLLSCPRSISAQAAAIQNALQKVETFSPRADSMDHAPELLHIIHDAHLDDIHCLKKLSDGTFVSGSKDNCIYKWNDRGELVKIVDEVEPTNLSERFWVTAIEVVNEEYFVSGARDGELVLWRTNGEYVKQIKGKMPRKYDHVSKPENAQRISCLAAGSNLHKPSIFVGFPTMFNNYNLIEGRTESTTKVSDNDWVWTIKPLTDNRILTVVAGYIDVWNKTNDGWLFGERVMKEEKKYQSMIKDRKTSREKMGMQRPFITDICLLNPQNTLIGFSSFNGSVQTLDLEKKRVVQRWNEHKGIVWKVEKFSEQMFASGSQDGCVKIWDVRQGKSVHTIDVSSGPVTAMLALNSHTLLTGTCPDTKVNKSAQIRFYELRK